MRKIQVHGALILFLSNYYNPQIILDMERFVHIKEMMKAVMICPVMARSHLN